MEAPLVSVSSKLNISFQHKPPRLVRWGFHPSPFGLLLIGTTASQSVCFISFSDKRNSKLSLKLWKDKWPYTNFIEDKISTTRIYDLLFLNKNLLNVVMVGTDFQKAVWKKISKIPQGRTVSYTQIAQAINRPKAVRAVGSACGANPVPLIVPCHRVIGANGGLGGFNGGIAIKRKLLKAEAITK